MTGNNTYVRSVIKALSILEEFISSDSEKGIHELSSSTGLPPSTIQRMVNTLELKGYLIQNPKSSKYRLGIALYNLSKNLTQHLNWIEDARHHIGELVQKHKETVNLAILEGKDIVYLTKVDSPHILRPNFENRTRYPSYCTALGKCLLSYQPQEIYQKILLGPFKPYTKSTITDQKKLMNELQKIREQGYAIDNEEFQDGLFCIAVPLKDNKNRAIASISMTIPKVRLNQDALPDIIKDIINTTERISEDVLKIL